MANKITLDFGATSKEIAVYIDELYLKHLNRMKWGNKTRATDKDVILELMDAYEWGVDYLRANFESFESITREEMEGNRGVLEQILKVVHGLHAFRYYTGYCDELTPPERFKGSKAFRGELTKRLNEILPTDRIKDLLNIFEYIAEDLVNTGRELSYKPDGKPLMVKYYKLSLIHI